MKKYCRICWNTKNWQCPTGEAHNLESDGAYVAKNGFGHEEWLFNFSWLLKGFDPTDANTYRYGFLQPINKYLNKYEGKTLSVLLYAISPEKRFLVVARIDNLYVPKDEERDWVLNQMQKRGWLKQMQREVEELDFDNSPLVSPPAWDVVNSRFRPQDVTFYDPKIIVPKTHKYSKKYRYHPFNWNDDFLPESYASTPIEPPTIDDEYSPLRSEEERTRAASDGATYNPRHVQLQNRLYQKLCSEYGKEPVEYEDEFVDIKFQVNDTVTFIEIKMELTVKRCIRLALGQLLEYTHYPSETRAQKLIVVGDAFPKIEDVTYLKQLRTIYNIPVYYSRWDWDKESLSEEI
jgi:hypothetical protein